MDNEETQSASASPESQGDRMKNRVLKPGESFGNFRVVKCLTAGLIANYYHMQHVRDLHDVTVGIFHHRTSGDEKLLKRLQGLQKTLQGLNHEGIPKIVDCARINERHCIFLDMVKGQSLSQYFAKHGKPGTAGIDPDAATRIIAQLLGILGYAHTQGVDHRDLDSDLVFVKEDGSLHVLGLGIKSTLGVELFESIVSASVSPLVSNKTVGRFNSFDVMSPEYKGGVHEDSRVDVYGVGALGYWLLTAQKSSLAKFVPPSSLLPELSKNWDVFFGRSLERDHEKRYQSCKMALIGLKKTDLEPDSERASFVQRQIDRIPVPKSIMDRGELATRVYRLSIIGLIGLTLTALAASFVKVVFTDTETYVRDVAKVVAAGQRPDLRIRVTPAVAKLQFVDFGDKFIAMDGLIQLSVQPGDYKLLVTAPNHIEKKVAVTIARGREQVVDLEVELRPAWTDFKINSEPGAAVSVVDDRGVEIELGVADEAGVFFLKKGIFAGTYEILVQKAGYESRKLGHQEVTLGEMTEIDMRLVPLPASLTVRTQPAGARILINDEWVGQSPLTVEAVKSGAQYIVVAHLEGYRSIGRRVEVEAGEAELVDFGALETRSGALAFEVSFSNIEEAAQSALMEELSVEVDGQVYPYGSSELQAIREGRHTIRLLHPLYISPPQEVVVKDREQIQLKVALSPRPGVVEFVMPPNLRSAVRVNKQAVAIKGGRIEVPTGEAVEIEVRIQNHLTMVRQLRLEPNERFVWKVVPTPIPGPTLGEDWTLPYSGHPFAWLAPGAFQMGSPLPEPSRLPNEGPQTSVRFTQGFWASIYEVTQAQYLEIMGRNDSEFLGPRKPVENVTWQDAKRFCELLTRAERTAGRLPQGYVYRLPTEAEWEYAARAGTVTPFSFGAEADATNGNFRGVYPKGREGGVRTTDLYGTIKVGAFPPNAAGLHDVHGNVQEWTLDAYNGRLAGGSVTDPAPRTDGNRVAARGGSWENFANAVRCAAREEIRPDTKSNAVGFRVFLAPEK